MIKLSLLYPREGYGGIENPEETVGGSKKKRKSRKKRHKTLKGKKSKKTNPYI